MHADDVLSLGLGVTPPWKLVGQRLDTDKRPNELHIEVAADRGALCPECPFWANRDRWSDELFH